MIGWSGMSRISGKGDACKEKVQCKHRTFLCDAAVGYTLGCDARSVRSVLHQAGERYARANRFTWYSSSPMSNDVYYGWFLTKKARTTLFDVHYCSLECDTWPLAQENMRIPILVFAPRSVALTLSLPFSRTLVLFFCCRCPPGWRMSGVLHLSGGR